MKRGWAALLLILIALGAGTAETLYTHNNIHVCIDMLNEADALMEQNETAKAQSVAERLDNRYSRLQDVLDVFLFHSEVLDIGTGLASLRRYAQVGDTSEFLAASARIKRTLLSLHNTRIPRLSNIL